MKILLDTYLYFKLGHLADNHIKKLSFIAAALPYCTNPHLLKYGQNTKRLNYKEMAIIFAIYGSIVYIHRIVPANSVLDL